jgi:hypothetical protein
VPPAGPPHSSTTTSRPSSRGPSAPSHRQRKWPGEMGCQGPLRLRPWRRSSQEEPEPHTRLTLHTLRSYRTTNRPSRKAQHWLYAFATWMTTREYRARFGHLDYAADAGTMFIVPSSESEAVREYVASRNLCRIAGNVQSTPGRFAPSGKSNAKRAAPHGIDPIT